MSQLTDLFSDIADAIRGKTGESAAIKAADFPTAIAGIKSGVEGAKVFGPILGDGSSSITVPGMENSENFAVIIKDWIVSPLNCFWIIRRYKTQPNEFLSNTAILYFASTGYQFRVDASAEATASGDGTITVPGYSSLIFSDTPYYVIRFD